jgi:hypothetical protein
MVARRERTCADHVLRPRVGRDRHAREYTILLKEWAREILGEGRPPSYPMSLAAVTELAFGQLRENNPAAAEVAKILALLEAELVPAEWFAEAAATMPPPLDGRAADPLAWRRALAALNRSGLPRVDQDGLAMHRLTRAIVRGYLMAGQSDAPQRRAAALLAAKNPTRRVPP